MENSVKTADEIRREYHRQWRAEHKDRVREYNRRFWEKRAAKQQTENATGIDDEKGTVRNNGLC